MGTSVNLARQRSLYDSFSDRARATAQTDIARLNEQMSTRKRVNRASDDPTSFRVGSKLEALDKQHENYLESVQSAGSWVTAMQSSLDGLAEFYMDAYERGVRLSNDTFSQDERDDFADAIESVLKSVPDQLNAKFGDEYLFGGTDSTNPPFVTIDPPDGTTDTSGTRYEGNDLNRIRRLGPDSDLAINIPGRELWEVDTDNDGTREFTITESLHSLVTAVRAGNATDIKTALGQVQISRDHLIHLGAKAGAISKRLNTIEDQLLASQEAIKGRASELLDADLTSVVTDLQNKQSGLEAALKVFASTAQMSLLDYLD